MEIDRPSEQVRVLIEVSDTFVIFVSAQLAWHDRPYAPDNFKSSVFFI
jgi:hypothetical protein